MQYIGCYEAKTHLSELLDKVSRGDVIIITKRGKPVAELRPYGKQTPAKITPQEVFERMMQLRKSIGVINMPIRDIINEGRKY
jgi:prevent-host-death family protein